MSDSLLIGWIDIHEQLFCDRNGKRSISLSTLMQKHGPGLKACGAVFKYQLGHSRTNTIAGWLSVIQNYFIKLGQKEEAERTKAKLAKQSHPKLAQHQSLGDSANDRLDSGRL